MRLESQNLTLDEIIERLQIEVEHERFILPLLVKYARVEDGEVQRCLTCHELYVTTTVYQHSKCMSCYSLERREALLKTARFSLVCLYCGTFFRSHRKSSKFCCKKCYTDYLITIDKIRPTRVVYLE